MDERGGGHRFSDLLPCARPKPKLWAGGKDFRERRGDVGTAVAWLDARLRSVDGDSGGAYRPAVFDAAMETRVRKLQRSFGIPDDGIVGPETFFALSSLRDAGPHLAHNIH